jgi:UDP-N-acetylmuramate--alanine ligase
MHVYFSGIGGSIMSSLALLAKQAGYEVSGSDGSESSYTNYLRQHGINDFHIGQSEAAIAKVHATKPIDWLVYTPAIPITDPNHPELVFCKQHHIKASRQDEFIQKLISDRGLKMIAVAGTHGKSTTTSMMVWLFKQLDIPVSYALATKVSFGELSLFDEGSKYFVLEADEYDKKFLSYHPALTLITGIDWDHPDIFPSRDLYNQAFADFLSQSREAVAWEDDLSKIGYSGTNVRPLSKSEPDIDLKLSLPGLVNRQDAWLVATTLEALLDESIDEMVDHLNNFPGLSRRFEQIAPSLYSDYAHTPPKIRGALQLAHEVGGDKVVVVYEGLHNTRQHFIKEQLADLFDDVKQLYIVPSFLAREDKNLKLLAPTDLLDLLSERAKAHSRAAELDDELERSIRRHLDNGDLVLSLSAGSGKQSLDDWLRQKFTK